MRGIFTAAVVLGALAAAPAPARAFTLHRTRQGHAVHWASSTVAVQIDPSAQSGRLSDEEARRALDRALAAWSSLPEARVRLRQPRAGEGLPLGLNLVAFRTQGWTDDPLLVGKTSLRSDESTGEIAAVLVEINEEHHHLDAAALETVLLHEIGHLLGLDHSDDAGAVMFATRDAKLDAGSPRAPGDDDRAGLRALYDGGAGPTVVMQLRMTIGKRDLTACTRAVGDGYVVGPCEAPAASVDAAGDRARARATTPGGAPVAAARAHAAGDPARARAATPGASPASAMSGASHSPAARASGALPAPPPHHHHHHHHHHAP